MDVTLIKTFIEVVNTGNFVAASERLFVSQSAVSLRIKSLEEHLSRPVFIRGKGGVTLTPAGDQFLRYAYSFLQIWEEAKQQVAVPEGYKDVLVIAGQYELWNRLLIRWLPLLADTMSEIAFRAEVARPDRIMRQMVEGTVDIAVVYSPQARAGINIKRLFEDKLVLVSTQQNAVLLPDNYIFVDWGEEFSAFHATSFPDYNHPRMTFDLGPLSINYILNNGGSCYMPERLVEPYLTKKMLFEVNEAPSFDLPVHVAWRTQIKNDYVTQALQSLDNITQQMLDGDLQPPFWVE